jgi:DNA polymerase-4
LVIYVIFMRERSIIHINVADFAVAVERRVDSRLRKSPVIIAHDVSLRANVYDMSEESYQSGVRKGMGLQRALRYCRDAVVLPPHPARYEQAMVQLLKHALPYSPLIEVTDHNGHLFIDATGTERLFGPPPDVAWRIRKAIRSDMGLDPIWSVAPNKLVAKAATRVVKPAGEYIIGTGEEADFMNPLPIHFVPGIQRQELKCLREFNLSRAGHVAGLSMEQLHIMFGIRCHSLYDAVRGIDPSPVFPVGKTFPVISVEHVFGNDTNTAACVEGALYRLVEKAGIDLRKQGLATRRVRIVLDHSDGKRMIRQAPVDPATANDFRLFAAAKTALEMAWKRRVRIRRLCLVCDCLAAPPAQMALFGGHEQDKKKSDNLISTLDAIRNRFGFNAIRMAVGGEAYGR